MADVGKELQFSRVFEKNVGKYDSQHNECLDCSKMPQFFCMTDHFPLPEGFEKRKLSPGAKYSSQEYTMYIKIECERHDFSRFSTDFDMFSDNHDVKIYDEAFDITPEKTIINDYTTDETTIRVGQNLKKMKLIPLDKWPLGDKNKLSEKFDKLLVLM